jgi:hypothetical protein
MTRRTVILVTALACYSCSSPTVPTNGVPVLLTRFDSNLNSSHFETGYAQPATLVVRDQATWQATWSQLYMPFHPPPPIPDVDFSTEMVVVAAAGSQPTSGYDIVFTGASEAGGTVTVNALTTSPSRCVVLDVVTQPVDLARMPKLDEPVVFRITSGVHSCG